MKNVSINLKYIIYFIIILFTEILIALFIDDNFIRPYIGDVLVVVLLYFLVRIFINSTSIFVAFAVFLFAFFVEILQYVKFVELIGMENNRFIRTIIGTTFDIKDIVSYFFGFLAIALFIILHKRLKNI